MIDAVIETIPSSFPVDADGGIEAALLDTFNQSAESHRRSLTELSPSEWFELCRLRGVRLRPVSDDPELVAFLVLHCRMGWVIYFNRHLNQERMKRAICHELAEHALADRHECPESPQVRQNRHLLAEQIVKGVFQE